ncbi:hypothetical protein F4778DRAFT_81035 [Xylariomycetidae sp. FL2044]|nr:hypothetical protein F4778DRAFT_81035 [Xylariomycetidae sp. FL2044]
MGGPKSNSNSNSNPESKPTYSKSKDSERPGECARYAWRKGPRKFAPKTRKGCRTCKIRRIKCDLAEPYCHKCTSTGRKCEGYVNTGAQKVLNSHDEPTAAAAAGPRGNDGWHQGPAIRRSSPSPQELYGKPIRHSLPPTPSLLSATPAENAALQFFEAVTLRRLNQHRRSPAWRRTLLFCAHTLPSVRHAAIALATTHQAFRQGRHFIVAGGGGGGGADALPVPQGGQVTAEQHHYNLAIRHLLLLLRRDDTNRADEYVVFNTVVTLMVCYLFTAADILANRHQQAAFHLRSGIRVLRETRERFMNDKARDSDLARNREIIDALLEHYRRLDRHATICYGSRLGTPNASYPRRRRRRQYPGLSPASPRPVQLRRRGHRLPARPRHALGRAQALAAAAAAFLPIPQVQVREQRRRRPRRRTRHHHHHKTRSAPLLPEADRAPPRLQRAVARRHRRPADPGPGPRPGSGSGSGSGSTADADADTLGRAADSAAAAAPLDGVRAAAGARGPGRDGARLVPGPVPGRRRPHHIIIIIIIVLFLLLLFLFLFLLFVSRRIPFS